MLTPLKHERLRLGIKQFDLAIETKILPWKLSRFEKGKLEPTPEELKKLLKAIPTLKEFPGKITAGIER